MPRPLLALRNARSRSIRPRLEWLEPRRLLAAKPAAQVTFVETPDAPGSATYTLQVVGTTRNDSIFLVDDGKHAAGSLRITANGTQTYTNLHPLSTIAIATRAGRDQVLYNLQGGLAAGPAETILVGSAGVLDTSIKGGGNLRVTANIAGPIAPGSGLTLFANPDRKGATTLAVNHSGAVAGSLAVVAGGIMTTGPRTGPVTFTMNSTATVAASGALVAGVVGTATRTLMNANYAGANDGNISFVGIGQGAKDVLSAQILMSPGSTGTVGADTPAQLADRGATPQVRFFVTRGPDSTSTTGIKAQLTTTSRRSVSTHTANVMTLAAGRDSTVA